ncbi:hypothetical protein CDAR_407081 [Caerostris darwini]|uniref:Uncharacterized protein n=2 Tax=Caerostris darwini TaxID=1538125 RepID=A0AAV4Q189_9ARAC|nr:hypothetical protein CDAR_407081 [Caerostris darwini]
MTPFEEIVEELRRDYHSAVLSEQVPVCSSFLIQDYLKDLWANARLVTEKDRRKVVTKHDITSVLYKRAEYQGAVLSNQVPIHCIYLILAQSEYYGVDLSNQVPIHCSLLKGDYLKDLWANARLVTEKDRRKMVNKYDIMSALYKRAEYQGAVLSNQRDVTLNMTPFEEIVEELRRDYHSAVLSEQVPVCSSFPIEDYRKDLWANARRETSRLHLRRFFRAFQRDVTLNMTPFEEIVEELRRDYHSAVLSEQVPVCSSFLIEDYRKDLWANARRETSRLHLRRFFSCISERRDPEHDSL